MHKDLIKEINDSITKNKKVIIALGDSFVQGHGAISEDIYDNYKWKSVAGTITWYFNKEEKDNLISKYPRIRFDNFKNENNCVFTYHEYDNAFVSVLCNKYFNGTYTPINFGIPGSGNRAAIKELYYYPDILWNEIEDIIVIYCPSGPERLDFIDDRFSDPNGHARWKTAWPRDNTTLSETDDGFKKEFWNAYNEYLYSEKFVLLEQITYVQELLLWCKYKKAHLIITPGFNRSYDKKHFKKIFNRDVIRDNKTSRFVNDIETVLSKKETKAMINMWPWENMFSPDGCPTFMDLVMKQEFPNTWEYNEHFYEYCGKGSPEKWVAPCAHPSVKGHDVFARYLYNHITENIL